MFLSSALSIASISYNPIVTTSIQGVSRAVAQSPDADQPAAIRRALKVHTGLTIPLSVGFLLLAGPIGRAVGAPHIVPALRIISGVLLCYGLYAPLIGVVNGQKRFLYQAGLDIACATLRTAGLVAGGWWLSTCCGRGVEGATAGFVVAALLVLLAAAGVVGFGRPGAGGPTVKQHLVFIAPLLLGQTLLNLLLQADLTLLRIFGCRLVRPYSSSRQIYTALRIPS